MIEPVKSRTQRVISYGPLRSIVEVVDQGWVAEQGKPALNMTLRYTQYAGHRDTDVDLFFNRDATDYRFSTGVINVKGSTELNDQQGLRGCWGTDYPSTDTLKWKPETVGLAVLVGKGNVVAVPQANKDNYGLVVRPEGRHMAYKVACASANEEFGFHKAEEWFAWMKKWRTESEQPIRIQY